MEHKTITNFLNKTSPEDIARFTSKKWVEILIFLMVHIIQTNILDCMFLSCHVSVSE